MTERKCENCAATLQAPPRFTALMRGTRADIERASWDPMAFRPVHAFCSHKCAEEWAIAEYPTRYSQLKPWQILEHCA